MSSTQVTEPPSKLYVFAIHAALGLPLNVAAVPLAFFGALTLREALGEEPKVFDEMGMFAVFAVLIAAVMFSALISGAAIARGAGRTTRGVMWAALLTYPLGLILTVLASDWLLDSPQLSLLHAAEASIQEHGFMLVKSLERGMPGSGLQRFLMMIIMSPVFLVLGLFDILMMPFVPLTDSDFYVALFKLIPYFFLVLFGSALPAWAVARVRGR
jgi:hypothetical protein